MTRAERVSFQLLDVFGTAFDVKYDKIGGQLLPWQFFADFRTAAGRGFRISIHLWCHLKPEPSLEGPIELSIYEDVLSRGGWLPRFIQLVPAPIEDCIPILKIFYDELTR
jgi:hypothetical protein